MHPIAQHSLKHTTKGTLEFPLTLRCFNFNFVNYNSERKRFPRLALTIWEIIFFKSDMYFFNCQLDVFKNTADVPSQRLGSILIDTHSIIFDSFINIYKDYHALYLTFGFLLELQFMIKYVVNVSAVIWIVQLIVIRVIVLRGGFLIYIAFVVTCEA